MLRFGLPLLVLAALLGLFYRGLALDPRALPSALIDRPLPAFERPALLEPERTITDADWRGEVALVNVWATWCSSCRQEHGMLMRLARENGIALYGIDYKDQPRAAIAYLDGAGNPYREVVSDRDGRLGMDLGVYGTPETFVLDRQGVIRYRHAGPITDQVWEDRLRPVIEHLEATP